MEFRGLLLLVGVLTTANAIAACENMPWQFGMSPEEVSAIAECGPYKSFSNGDLETYRGVFDGKEENFQFFFQGGKLRRIGIYLYEGQDPSAGAMEWLSLHGAMAKHFGAIETPGNALASASKADRSAFTQHALQAVLGPGKTQMAPASQPQDAFVFSSFMRREVNGESYYYVVLYFDSRSQ